MLDTPRRRPPYTAPVTVPHAWALIPAAATPAVLVLGWLVAEALQTRPYDPLQETISVLSGLGADHRWVMTAALFAVGACHLLTAAGMRGVHPAARALIAAGGAAGLGVAVFPQPAGGSSFDHMAFAVTGAVVLTLWPFILALSRPSVRSDGSGGAWDRMASREGCLAAGLIIAVSAIAMYVTAQMGMYLGLTERICTLLQSLYPLLLVLALRAQHRP